MGLNSRIIHYGDQQYLWSKFLVFIPLLLISCGVQKTNPYEMNYQELHPTITTTDQDNKKHKYRPEVMAFKNSSLSINEYQNLKTKGYKLLGYSVFHDEAFYLHTME